MGKKMIIKDVNFSANALRKSVIIPTDTTWYIDYATRWEPGYQATANANSGGWAFHNEINAKLCNKTINAIKLIPRSSGTLNLYIVKNADFNKSLTSPVASISLNGDSSNLNIETYILPSSIVVPDGYSLVFGEQGTSGVFVYMGAGGIPSTYNDCFYRKVGQSTCDYFGDTTTEYSVLQISVGFVK